MSYKLNVTGGKIRYIAKAGKDLVQAVTTPESAEWMMKNKAITRATPTDWPTYCVCAGGEYWFEGTWDDDEPSIFNAEATPAEAPADPSPAEPAAIFDEKPQDRPRTNRRNRRGD